MGLITAFLSQMNNHNFCKHCTLLKSHAYPAEPRGGPESPPPQNFTYHLVGEGVPTPPFMGGGSKVRNAVLVNPKHRDAHTTHLHIHTGMRKCIRRHLRVLLGICILQDSPHLNTGKGVRWQFFFRIIIQNYTGRAKKMRSNRG